MKIAMDDVVRKLGTELSQHTSTLGELVAIAEREGLPLSSLVVAEAMAKEKKSYQVILSEVMELFRHNLEALKVGLTWGKSFLLGTVGSDLARQTGRALIDDSLIDRALINTLATEVGNHEVGLRPCAGTGDSCPYTGLIKALLEEGISEEKVALAAALILKVGSVFRTGKRTTGCNMEGYGAGAAATAAALTDLRGGSPQQVANAIVLALSPTIAVPCTPRVMVSGLCATHIGGAILVGNLASNLILKTSLPVDVDVDVMLAMAAKVHVQAAPIITDINLEYLGPYFRKKPEIEPFVDDEIRKVEKEQAENIVQQAREEVRSMLAGSRPLTDVLGDVVVGGSSIAVGSPTNMARICHAMIAGEIKRIEVDLTIDLFARRAINMPAILMAAIYGAKTDDIDMYRKVFDLPEIKGIEVKVNRVDVPEVQRIRIEATEKSAMLDARNRGGGRVAIVAAEPSVEEARAAAAALGIQIVD
ncbi:MAG: serine dehydratase [Chloroflexota bacterium]